MQTQTEVMDILIWLELATIIEWLRLEGILEIISFLSWAEHFPLDQATQSSTQPGFDHSQGWDIHNFFVNPVLLPPTWQYSELS